MRVTRGVSDLRAGSMQISAGPAWSGFESVTTVWTGGYLLADQAVKTPTKPADVWNAIADLKLITLGSFRNWRRHHRSGIDSELATTFFGKSFATLVRSRREPAAMLDSPGESFTERSFSFVVHRGWCGRLFGTGMSVVGCSLVV